MFSNSIFQDVQKPLDPSSKWQARTFLQNNTRRGYPLSVMWLAEIFCSQWNYQCGEKSLCCVLFLIHLSSTAGYRTSVLSHSPAHQHLPCQWVNTGHGCRSKIMFGWTFLSTLDFLLVEHFFQGNFWLEKPREKNRPFQVKLLKTSLAKAINPCLGYHEFLKDLLELSQSQNGFLYDAF